MKVLMIVCLLVSGQLAAQDLEAVTDWSNRVELTTLASGMVGRVNVAVGATVSRGELLLELDQRRFKTKLAAAESRLEAATQQNSEAKRELDRALELYDRTLLRIMNVNRRRLRRLQLMRPIERLKRSWPRSGYRGSTVE
ncbi:MAG: biotin/lipoyl-binding protein [Candidatus Thiodiazotropha sp. (ex Rostrolucina anterorostrata)]|nr:biotin/lipoyl-binding protein [Candidatus Thiodiazotropha sp. (ex Rostrolucina anterorostrata)]